MRDLDLVLRMLNIKSENKHFSERASILDIAQNNLSHVEGIQYSIR
jgi:hypothetical protein